MALKSYLTSEVRKKIPVRMSFRSLWKKKKKCHPIADQKQTFFFRLALQKMWNILETKNTSVKCPDEKNLCYFEEIII